MLYELALPALLFSGSLRWLRNCTAPSRALPCFRLRAARCRLRRLEIVLLTRLSPRLGAWLALRRFERTRPDPDAFTSFEIGTAETVRVGRLFARVMGPLDASRLLLVHGWNADGKMMLPLAQALAAAGYRVFVPDLPGEGGTGGRRLTFVQKAKRLAEACNSLGPLEAVIGHSAGGLMAAMAGRHRLPAERLVTISAPASMATLLTTYLERTNAPSVLQESILSAYRALRGQNPGDVGPPDYRHFGSAHLVIHARNDWQVRPQEAEQICSGRPGMFPLIVHGCNHHSILRHPATHEAIASFLTPAEKREGASC